MLKLGMKALWPEMTSTEAKGQWESPGSESGVNEWEEVGWFVWDSALPRLLLADLRPSRLPASSLLSVRLPAATHADASHYLLMAFPGSSWQHSHYLWAGGPLQRLLMQAPKLSSLCISWRALIKREGSQHSKWCACFNHMGARWWAVAQVSRWGSQLWICSRDVLIIQGLSSSPSDVGLAQEQGAEEMNLRTEGLIIITEPWAEWQLISLRIKTFRFIVICTENDNFLCQSNKKLLDLSRLKFGCTRLS